MEDKIDLITMDVPLFLRILEYSKEDAKTDMDLHFVLENILKLSKENSVLTMDNYDKIVDIKNSNEEINNNVYESKLLRGKEMNIRKLVESKLFEGEYLGNGNFKLDFKLMGKFDAAQAGIFDGEWEDADISKPVYTDEVDELEFFCYTRNDGKVVVVKNDPYGNTEELEYNSYKDAGVDDSEGDYFTWNSYYDK